MTATAPSVPPPALCNMQMSEPHDQVSLALFNCQNEVEKVHRGGRNEFHKYNYARAEDVVDAITEVMRKHGLALVTCVMDSRELDPRTTRSGELYFRTRVKMSLTVIHGESGQWIQTFAQGDGEDGGDKGIYKATTGTKKYGIYALFNLTDTNDPENNGNNGAAPRSAPQQPNKPAPQQTQPRPAAPPQRPQQQPQGDGSGVFRGEFTITQVQDRQPGKSGKLGPYRIFANGEDGDATFSTFSDGEANSARACCQDALVAVIEWTEEVYNGNTQRKLKSCWAQGEDNAPPAAPQRPKAQPQDDAPLNPDEIPF